MVDIYQIGRYRAGMTKEDIVAYLKLRAGTTVIGTLFKKFCSLAKIKEAEFKVPMTLMEREEIVLIADTLFTPTDITAPITKKRIKKTT